MGGQRDHAPDRQRETRMGGSDAPPAFESTLLGPGGLSALAQSAELQALQCAGYGDDAQATTAARGLTGTARPLPHGERIQRAFGRHDVSNVQAHIGGPAERAAMAMNAQAYATGQSVAFAREPDLHLAAHEAAHVVQQRGGVSSNGGIGRTGDPHERHADAVADTVVAGRSAERLLDRYTGTGPGVQPQKQPPAAGVDRDGADKVEDDAAPDDPSKNVVPPPDDGKTTFIVNWSGEFGGDLSARVRVRALGKERAETSTTVADPDGGRGATTQTMKAKLRVPAARRMQIEVEPTAADPEDRYRTTRKTVRLTDTLVSESHHAVSLRIKRTNEKNVVDVWKQRGIDPKKALKVHAQTLLGHRVQLNAATKPTVDKTNAALGKLDAATQKQVVDSIARIGGYNRRTTSKGTFSHHSIGCAIDVNYNGDTKQNHHFYKKAKSHRRLLEFVQKVVKTDPAMADFDIWKSKGQRQLAASKAFEQRFPLYLQSLLGGAAPTTPVEDEGPPAFDLEAVDADAVKTAAGKATGESVKSELQLIASELTALKAWVLGAEVRGQRLVGMVPIDEKLLQVMMDGGWSWGGDWSSAKDYMHFEDEHAMASLKQGAGDDAK